MTTAGDFRAVATEYLREFRSLLDALDITAIEAAVDALRRVRDDGGTVFIAGNGGSAATASHLANDLGKATRQSGQRPIRVQCLSDNIPWFSALANDEGYERVFAGQLENFAQPDDVLIVISASGNSTNLIRAVELAQVSSMVTVGLVGFDGGQLLELVDVAMWVKSEVGAYGPVESAHAVLADIVTTCLIRDTATA
ncbi:MAG: SIS domain-containing protein [Actinobacteria bacterium]|nr:SIS domain-containing protein [Actinomycetota bacterium]